MRQCSGRPSHAGKRAPLEPPSAFVRRTGAQPHRAGQHLGAFPNQPWLLIARPLGAFGLAVLLSLSLTLLPERQLLAMALLSERRMNQPLSSIGLLDRSSGLIGTGANGTRCWAQPVRPGGPHPPPGSGAEQP